MQGVYVHTVRFNSIQRSQRQPITLHLHFSEIFLIRNKCYVGGAIYIPFKLGARPKIFKTAVPI